MRTILLALLLLGQRPTPSVALYEVEPRREVVLHRGMAYPVRLRLVHRPTYDGYPVEVPEEISGVIHTQP